MLVRGVAMAAPPCSARMPYRSTASSADYRLRRIVVDPVLRRRWEFIEDCSHPERPAQMIELPAESGGRPTRNVNVASRIVPMDIPRAEGPPAIRNSAVASVRAILVQVPAASPTAQNPFPSSAPRSPSMPARSIRPSTRSSGTPLVRAGDRVHLWSSAANVRLEIEVIALEYGRAGQVIHLRRNGQQALLAGVVVGTDSAELMP